MIVPDVNLLLYAVDQMSDRHDSSRAWLQRALSQDEEMGLAWVVILGFIRIITRRRANLRLLSVEEACAVVDNWLAHRNVRVLQPTSRHAEILFRLLKESGATGNLSTDAHIAALAIEYGAEVHSADGDFGRFEGVRWKNPLES